jgi:hypothetical protein
MDRFKAQTFMEEQIKSALGPNGDFTPRKDKDQNWIIPTPGSIRGLMPVRPRTAGPTGFDMAYQALDKLPKIASARRDIMIKRDRLELNLDVIQNGGKPSADFNVLVKASGLSTPQFIQKQLKFYPDLKYNPAADAGTQTYQENLKYDRVAAEGLATPRIVGEQRDRLKLRIQRAKQQQTSTSFVPGGQSDDHHLVRCLRPSENNCSPNGLCGVLINNARALAVHIYGHFAVLWACCEPHGKRLAFHRERQRSAGGRCGPNCAAIRHFDGRFCPWGRNSDCLC